MLLRIMENILCYNPLRVIPKVESFEYMFLYTDIQLFILFPSAKDFANFMCLGPTTSIDNSASLL